MSGIVNANPCASTFALENAGNMAEDFFSQPILNSPYEYPGRHWELDKSGQPTNLIGEIRRPAEFITPIPKPKKKKASRQKELDLSGDEDFVVDAQQYAHTQLINELRRLVDDWRTWPDPNSWKVTRLALKLATGAGKTTVMAMLIAWQTINAVRRPGGKTFTRGFLIVAPGITIKDRLRVLQPNDPDSYYKSREIVPSDMLGDMEKPRLSSRTTTRSNCVSGSSCPPVAGPCCRAEAKHWTLWKQKARCSSE